MPARWAGIAAANASTRSPTTSTISVAISENAAAIAATALPVFDGSGEPIPAGVIGPGNDPIDSPTGLSNSLDAVAMSGIQVHPGGNQLQVQFWMLFDCGKHATH